MTDQELLELAAKAADLAWEWNACSGSIEHIPKGYRFYVKWNPLTDDGDAFRLALKLQIKIEYWPENDSVLCSLPGSMGATSVAAIGDVELRYAIVQAAAQKGLTL